MADTTTVTKEDVLEALRDVYDPEIPVNIVDLGLVYEVAVADADVEVQMTLTFAGCGMGPSIAQDVDNKVSTLPGVNDVLVEVVWDPVWDQSMMSEDAKLKLGMF